MKNASNSQQYLEDFCRVKAPRPTVFKQRAAALVHATTMKLIWLSLAALLAATNIGKVEL